MVRFAPMERRPPRRHQQRQPLRQARHRCDRTKQLAVSPRHPQQPQPQAPQRPASSSSTVYYLSPSQLLPPGVAPLHQAHRVFLHQALRISPRAATRLLPLRQQQMRAGAPTLLRGGEAAPRAVWLQDLLRPSLRRTRLRRLQLRSSSSRRRTQQQQSPQVHAVRVENTKPLPLPPPPSPQQPAAPPHAPPPSTLPLHQGTEQSSRTMGMTRTGFLTPVGQRKGWMGRISRIWEWICRPAIGRRRRRLGGWRIEW